MNVQLIISQLNLQLEDSAKKMFNFGEKISEVLFLELPPDKAIDHFITNLNALQRPLILSSSTLSLAFSPSILRCIFLDSPIQKKVVFWNNHSSDCSCGISNHLFTYSSNHFPTHHSTYSSSNSSILYSSLFCWRKIKRKRVKKKIIQSLQPQQQGKDVESDKDFVADCPFPDKLCDPISSHLLTVRLAPGNILTNCSKKELDENLYHPDWSPFIYMAEFKACSKVQPLTTLPILSSSSPLSLPLPLSSSSVLCSKVGGYSRKKKKK